jgi:hypothetical protein
VRDARDKPLTPVTIVRIAIDFEGIWAVDLTGQSVAGG